MSSPPNEFEQRLARDFPERDGEFAVEHINKRWPTHIDTRVPHVVWVHGQPVGLVRVPAGRVLPVPTRERRCEVCGCCADPEQTSAHHARVIYLCTWHGKRFHVLEFLWRETPSTMETLARIDLWLRVKREQLARAA